MPTIKLPDGEDLVFNKKVNGFEPSSLIVSVETNAQLFSAAYKFLSSVIGVPIAHKPLPGGKNFILNILSNISCADF